MRSLLALFAIAGAFSGPLLRELPEESRPVFRYGGGGSPFPISYGSRRYSGHRRTKKLWSDRPIKERKRLRRTQKKSRKINR